MENTYNTYSDIVNTECLNKLCNDLPNLLKDKNKWKSLNICMFEPVIHRIYINLDNGCSLFLHRIFPCLNSQPLMHSHSWPFVVHVIEGGYNMSIGFSTVRDSPPQPIFKSTVKPGDTYEMLSPDIWHTTHAINTDSYSIMLVGPRWRSRIALNNDPLDQFDFDHLYSYFLNWSNVRLHTT
jgi:hypothetical protein